jgi:hypothetical protein
VTGDIVDDRPWGHKMYVGDGSGPLLVFIAAATRIDVTRYRARQDLRVTGFSGRFGAHTEILPRSQSDIAIASERGTSRKPGRACRPRDARLACAQIGSCSLRGVSA